MKKKKIEEVKNALADIFELPKEIMLNMPKISLIGSNQMLIENHKGIIEYTVRRIRINSSIGVIRVTGNEMNLKNIAVDDIMISGEIKTIEFI